jgi:DNA-binding NtrC family response regulator
MVILVVEDDTIINLMAVEELQRAEHEVISAYSADQAIEILESRDDIRLIFTDIDMPGSMDGLKLAAAVRDRWPPVHIIITSGKHIPDRTQMPAGALFLEKPYPGSRLVEAVSGFG